MTATIRCATDGSIAGYQGIIRDITAQKQAEQERLRLATIERELAMARVFQQSLLPSTVPDWGSLEVVCYTRAAHEIGGDFYTYHDFGKSEDGTVQRFAVAVGDVSGKGMAAALLMAISLASFNTIITQTYSTDRHPIDCKHQSYTLEELLKYLSSAIGSYTKTSRQNCAFVYSEWTRCPDGSIMLRVGNAGCVAPVILREDRQVDWLDVGGLPLGVALDMPKHYVEMSLKLTEGDMVVLVSDGVIEARNIVGDMFGFERLLNAVERGPRSSGGAMLAHLLAQLRSFVQGAEQHDDVTIAVVKA
jgi:serine phosphatase RsbU (regulator of sigma subunit)